MKKIIMTGWLLVLAALGTLFVSGGNKTYAAEEENPAGYLILSPSKVDLDTIKPGKSYSKSIDAHNGGDAKLVFDVTAETLTAAESDYSIQWGVAPSQYNKIAEWVSFPSGTRFELEPGAKTKIDFKVTVPQDAAGGAQHFMLLAKLVKQDAADATWNVESALGIQVYSNVDGDMIFAGNLLNHSIPAVSLDPNITTTSTIENTGNTDWVATYRLSVNNAFSGENVFDETKDNMFVLAGTKRVFNHQWTGAPALGLFNVVQEVTYFDESGERVTDTFEKLTLIIPLWLIMVFLAIIVLAVVSIVSRRKQAKAEESKPEKSGR